MRSRLENVPTAQLTVHNLLDESGLAREYRVRAVPTVVIDGEVKIEGRPDIPFVCSEELVHTLDIAIRS